MWMLRILSGPQRGQTFQLKEGRNILGRGASSHVQIASQGVSKEHCDLFVSQQGVQLTDLNSSNGTILNGVRVQKSKLKSGDKFSLNEIMLDVIEMAQSPMMVSRAGAPQPMYPGASYPSMGGAAGPEEKSSFVIHHHGGLLERLWMQFKDYLESVALPGVYKLAEVTDLKIVLMGLMGIFLLSVTLLAMIPMVTITRTSIMKESERRAQSLARTMADVTRSSWGASGPGPVSTTRIEVEEGVKKVIVVSQSDGTIIAPASQAGTTPNLPFVHRARREKRALSEVLDGDIIAASVPIEFYDPTIGEQSIKAHAIVLYDVAGLALDDGKIISLFMQTLLLASLVGLVIFYFLFKLVERPVVVLNSQLDLAMREKYDSTEVKFQFSALQALIGNINSLLTRYHHGEQVGVGATNSSNGLQPHEIENLVQIIGYPAIVVGSRENIMGLNSGFSQLTHLMMDQANGQSISVISDSALQQNIRNLIQLSMQNPSLVHSDSLEISGHNFKLSGQSLGQGEVFLIVVSPKEGESYG